MPAKKPLLICVTGPTATGKTKLAIAIARAFETEVLSADSRQFYKELSIGTAVPSAEELRQAPHHFIQHKCIADRYSVGDFEREAVNTLATLFAKRSIVVMVGGSGLYLDAVTEGLDSFPEIPSAIRNELNKEFEEKGIGSLQTALQQIDPDYFKQVDTNNPHRLIRALEVYRASGKPYSGFLKKTPAKRDFDTLWIGLTGERETIYQRINERVDSMVRQGLIEEAKGLYEFMDENALQTVGYRELFEYFKGDYTLEAAIAEIKKNTRRYAKRQGTWFRKKKQIHWFDLSTDPEEVIAFIKEKNAL